MFANSPTQLSPSSTIAELPTHSFRIEANTLGEVVAEEFQNRPELPGVIVVEGTSVVGVVSRRKFLELMSLPYSLELYLQRSISVLLEAIESDSLRLQADCSIEKAVRQALNRPPELLYEPIVVIQADGSLELLELHLLLLAQSQIFAQVTAWMRQQKDEARKYASSLKQEEAKVREYTQKLKSEQAEVQRRNQILELQRAQLATQTQEISDINERFFRIGELLSSEGKRTFQDLIEGVEAICNCTERIVEIGKAFSGELETVNNATQLIDRVSQQVRHLSIQAALMANRAQEQEGSAQLVGFSNITSEIGSLGSKTFEATNQVNQIAGRFRFQIQELVEAARESESIARSVEKRTGYTRTALSELESLVLERRQRASEDAPPASSESTTDDTPA